MVIYKIEGINRKLIIKYAKENGMEKARKIFPIQKLKEKDFTKCEILDSETFDSFKKFLTDNDVSFSVL